MEKGAKESTGKCIQRDVQWFLIKTPFLYECLNGHVNITSNGNFNQSLTAFSLSRLTWLPDQANFQPKWVPSFPPHLWRTLALFLCRSFTSLSRLPFVLLLKLFCFSYKNDHCEHFLKLLTNIQKNESNRLDIILEIEVRGQTLHVMLFGCLWALNYRQSMLSLALLAVLGHS